MDKIGVIFIEKEFYKNFIQSLEKELPNEKEFVDQIAELIDKNKFTKKTYVNLINKEIGD